MASVKFPAVFSNAQMKKRGRQLAFKMASSSPFKSIKMLKYARIQEMERKEQKLRELKISHPSIIMGSLWGSPTPSNFLHILKHLPPGTSEIVVHLGTYSRQEHYPSGLDLEYFDNREFELIVASSIYLEEYFSYLNIQKIGYSKIPTSRRND